MRIIVGCLATLLCLAACKQQTRSTEEPKARYEPNASLSQPMKQPERKAGALPTEQRAEKTLELETRIAELTKQTSDLTTKSQGMASPARETITTDLASFKTKLDGAAQELTSAKTVDETAWLTQRDKLDRDLTELRRELDVIAKKLS